MRLNFIFRRLNVSKTFQIISETLTCTTYMPSFPGLHLGRKTKNAGRSTTSPRACTSKTSRLYQCQPPPPRKFLDYEIQITESLVWRMTIKSLHPESDRIYKTNYIFPALMLASFRCTSTKLNERMLQTC